MKKIIQSIFKPQEFMLQLCKKNWNGDRKFVQLALFGLQSNTYVVTDIGLAKQMLSEVYQPKKPSGCPFKRATEMSKEVLRVLGTQSTLMTNDTRSHNEVRLLILKHFSEYQDSNFYEKIFNEVFDMEINRENISPSAISLKYTARVILNIVFGENIVIDIERASTCIEKISEIGFMMNRLRFLKPILKYGYNKQSKEIKSLLTELIDQAESDSFAVKMQAAGYNKEHIFSELITLFAAGHETSSSVITNAIFEMIQHPKASPNQIKQEVLRYYPPTWILSREHISGSSGVDLPHGTYLIPVYALNRNTSVLNGEMFDPYREKSDILSFGYGKYSSCSGASLAHKEIDVFLNEFNKIKEKFSISTLPKQKFSTVAKPVGGLIKKI